MQYNLLCSELKRRQFRMSSFHGPDITTAKNDRQNNPKVVKDMKNSYY
jgi:hypothetical protein